MQIRLKRPIVPIEQWLDDPFYLGPHALPGNGPYPFWRAEIIDFFSSPHNLVELIVTGSNRAGKTHNTLFFMLRVIYEISCIYDFPTLFGLSPSTNILFVFLSFNKGKAQDAGVKKILRLLEGIPYFEHVFPYSKRISSRVVFPGLEIRGGASAEDLISEDLYCVVFDEGNAVRAAAGKEFEKAKGIYMEAITRGQMTYSVGGKHYGFFALISSADSPTSFVESRVRLAQQGGGVKVITAPVYKVKPDAFSKEKFHVFIGVDDVDPHIIEEVTPEVRAQVNKTYGMTYEDFLAQHKDKVDYVPVDFIRHFREDIYYGLRFIMGRPTSTAGAFLKNRKAFEAIFDKGLKSPLMVELPTLSLLDDDIFEDYIDAEALDAMIESGAACYIHFDLGLKGDLSGTKGDFASFALAFKTEYGRIRVPLYTRVARSNASDEIDFSKLEDVVYWLIEQGHYVKLVTKDLLARGYFSQNLVRRLGKERVDDLSLDKSDVPFLVFSHLMKKGLIEAYPYKPFMEEFPLLLHDPVARKVIKPDGGFDDISQAFVAAVYDCFIGEGMSFESLAVMDALRREAPASDEDRFYTGALFDGIDDKFYSDILGGADEEVSELLGGLKGDEKDVDREMEDYEDQFNHPDRPVQQRIRDPRLRDRFAGRPARR